MLYIYEMSTLHAQSMPRNWPRQHENVPKHEYAVARWQLLSRELHRVLTPVFFYIFAVRWNAGEQDKTGKWCLIMRLMASFSILRAKNYAHLF